MLAAFRFHGCAKAQVSDGDVESCGGIGFYVNDCATANVAHLVVRQSGAEGVFVRNHGRLSLHDALLDQNGSASSNGDLHVETDAVKEMDCRCMTDTASATIRRATLSKGGKYGFEVDVDAVLSLEDAVVRDNQVGALLYDVTFDPANVLHRVLYQGNTMAICVGTEVASCP